MERWGRLLLAALVLPVRLAAGADADDGALPGISDSVEDDSGPLRLAAGADAGAAPTLLAVARTRRPNRRGANAPVVAGWTRLTPTDRAPSRLTVSRAPFPSLGSPLSGEEHET